MPDVEHVSRHQDAELHELRDRELRAAGIDTRVLPKVSGTGKTIKADPHARPCGPSPLLDDPMAMAALRAYVGQNDAIDGTWDPMTCTLTKPELPGAALPDPAPEPEDDPEQIALAAEREAARLKKAEKARKKRDKKKAAKKLSQGKANSSTELARKPVGSAEPGDKLNWQALGAPGVYGGSAPSPAVVRPEKPITTEDQLRSLGFGRKEREMLKTFQRLQRLTGLTDDLPELQSTHGDPYSSAGPSIAKQLEEYVERAGKVAEIVEAREICAKLSAIATDLVAEVCGPDAIGHRAVLRCVGPVLVAPAAEAHAHAYAHCLSLSVLPCVVGSGGTRDQVSGRVQRTGPDGARPPPQAAAGAAGRTRAPCRYSDSAMVVVRS